VSSLAERLGHRPDDRLLIINCDDLGSSYAANVGCYEALREGVATSATLMVPCPWARDAAARYRGEDVGVHLTLNAEYDLYRWGPITHAPSLLDGDGGFPRTVEDVWDHADLDEVRRELRAQVERAIYWGFDVSHLDSHMGTNQLNPAFFDAYLETAVDSLPEAYRTVFMLRDVEGLSTSETGEGLGLGEEAVKTRLHRARAMIRRAVTARIGSVASGAFQFHAPRCDRVVAAVLARIDRA